MTWGFPTFDDEVRAGCQLPDQHLDRIWAKKKLINTWRHGKIYRKAKSEFGKVMYWNVMNYFSTFIIIQPLHGTISWVNRDYMGFKHQIKYHHEIMVGLWLHLDKLWWGCDVTEMMDSTNSSYPRTAPFQFRSSLFPDEQKLNTLW